MVGDREAGGFDDAFVVAAIGRGGQDAGGFDFVKAVGLVAGMVPFGLTRRILPRRLARFCALAPRSLSPTPT